MFRDQLFDISHDYDVVLVELSPDVFDLRPPTGNWDKDCDGILSVTIRSADPQEKRQKILFKVLQEQDAASRRDKQCYSTWYMPISHRVCATMPSPVRLPQRLELDLTDEKEFKRSRSSSSSVAVASSASACSNEAADNRAPAMSDVDDNEEVKFTPTKRGRSASKLP